MTHTLGRQLLALLKGQLGLLQQSGCQQTASILQAGARCAPLQASHRPAVDIQQNSWMSGAQRSYGSSMSTSSEAGQPGGSSSSSSTSSTTTTTSSSSSSSLPGAGDTPPSRHDQPPSASPPAAEGRLPAAGAYTVAYGPRKVTPRSKKANAGAVKREGVVHVNSTFNNTMLVLTDRDSKVQTWTSGGTVGYKNANKATPMAAELAAKELARRAVDMGFHSVVVKLKGMGKNKQFAVQSLAANGLTVTQLWDVTPIPYNGCRLPRRRRV